MGRRDASAFAAAWDELLRSGRATEQYFRDMARELSSVGDAIEDAQRQWDMAMASLAVTTGIAIGLSVFSFGLSNAAAAAAASRTAATMAGVAAWLDGIVKGAGLVFMSLAQATATNPSGVPSPWDPGDLRWGPGQALGNRANRRAVVGWSGAARAGWTDVRLEMRMVR